MIINCSCCTKQCVSYKVPITDKYCTILKGAVASFNSNERICGYCAKDLDENGLFPEERGY